MRCSLLASSFVLILNIMVLVWFLFRKGFICCESVHFYDTPPSSPSPRQTTLLSESTTLFSYIFKSSQSKTIQSY